MSSFSEDSFSKKPLAVNMALNKTTLFSAILIYIISLTLIFITLKFGFTKQLSGIPKLLSLLWSYCIGFHLLFCLTRLSESPNKKLKKFVVQVHVSICVISLFIIRVSGSARMYFMQLLPFVFAVSYMVCEISVNADLSSLKVSKDGRFLGRAVVGCFRIMVGLYFLLTCALGFYTSIAIAASSVTICFTLGYTRTTVNIHDQVRRIIQCSVIILCLSLIFCYGPLLFSNVHPYSIVAHRGIRGGDVPENSLSAIKESILAGANWVEIDVQISQDNVLVVIHDRTVDRTTFGTGKVSSFTVNELKSLQMKSNSDAYQKETIPTLSQVLQLLKKFPNVGLVLELKFSYQYRGRGFEEKVLKLVKRYNMLHRTLFLSFDVESLITLKNLDPQVTIVLLEALAIQSLIPAPPFSAEIVGTDALLSAINPWMIMKVKRDGKKVYTWFSIRNDDQPSIVDFLGRVMGIDYVAIDRGSAVISELKK